MVMELIREGNDKKLEEVLKKTPEAGARQDSEGNSPAQRAIEFNQEGCLLKTIKANVKIPEVRAQVTSVEDQFEVVMDNKLKLSNIDQPTLKQILRECEVTQVDVKNGDPSLLKPARWELASTDRVVGSWCEDSSKPRRTSSNLVASGRACQPSKRRVGHCWDGAGQTIGSPEGSSRPTEATDRWTPYSWCLPPGDEQDRAVRSDDK